MASWALARGAPADTLYGLLREGFPPCGFPTPCTGSVEIVDLDTMTLVRNVPLGDSEPISLAVAPDQSRIYVSDRGAAAVRVLTSDGSPLPSIPLTGPGDLTLSSDGRSLYAAISGAVVRIDTSSGGVVGSGSLGLDFGVGIALSRDETLLGVAARIGGSSGVFYLFDAQTMALVDRIVLDNPGEPTNCGVLADDVTFTDGGRAVIWDSNCDNFYQVDVAFRTQLTTDTVRMGRDSGATYSGNVAQFSAVSGKAYALTLENGLATLTPSPASGSLTGGFAAFPFPTTLTPDETQLYVAVGTSPFTLDRLETASGTFARDVYTFSRAGAAVEDLAVATGSPPPPPAAGDRLYGLLREGFPPCGFPTPCTGSVEIVDLDTMTLVRNVPLGDSEPVSLAVAPDQSRIYVSDRSASAIRVLAPDGSPLPSISLPARAGDLVLSSDGSSLYATTAGAAFAAVKIDTSSGSVVGSGSLGPDFGVGIALSRDEALLGVAARIGGSSGVFYLFDAQTMALVDRIVLDNPGEPTNCGVLADDVTFTDGGRAVLWDSNCDNFYQVDVATRTQLTTDTVRMGRDSGATYSGNVAQFSAVSGKAYALTLENGLATLTPSPASGSLTGGFAAFPFPTTLTPDETQLYVAVGTSPFTLDRLDTASGTFARDVYTFSRAGAAVEDLRVAEASVPPAQALLRVARTFGAAPAVPYDVFETTPCTVPSDIAICDEAGLTLVVQDYVDPVLPLSLPGVGTLVFFDFDANTFASGDVDLVSVTKDAAIPGNVLVLVQ